MSILGTEEVGCWERIWKTMYENDELEGWAFACRKRLQCLGGAMCRSMPCRIFWVSFLSLLEIWEFG